VYSLELMGVDALIFSGCVIGRALLLTRLGPALGLVNPGFDQTGSTDITGLIADLVCERRDRLRP